MASAAEYFVVGDVQGCFGELEDLLKEAGFDARKHKLASVGDLINRGPASKAVLELMVDCKALVVVGNHEDSFIDGRKSDTMDRVRKELGPELWRWVDWMAKLPTFLRFDDWILVHAGIAPGKTPEECTRHELTRIREVDGKPWFKSWKGSETVIFGHWARLGKVDRDNAKGLDTGCVYGGRLTGIWWPSGKWVSVPARRQWFDPEKHQATW